MNGYLYPKQLAKLLKVTTRTIRRYVERGMPCDRTRGGDRTRGHARFDPAKVARWLREQKMKVPTALRGN